MLMTIDQYIFIFFCILTAASALLILFTRNVLYAAFALLTTFLGVAALFVFACADFLAISQIVIYVGGVLVLILFGVMISKRVAEFRAAETENKRVFPASLIGFILFGLLAYFIKESHFGNLSRLRNQQIIEGSTVQNIGENLMTNFIIPFEVSALLLMVALMGAVFIAGRLKRNS